MPRVMIRKGGMVHKSLVLTGVEELMLEMFILKIKNMPKSIKLELAEYLGVKYSALMHKLKGRRNFTRKQFNALKSYKFS